MSGYFWKQENKEVQELANWFLYHNWNLKIGVVQLLSELFVISTDFKGLTKRHLGYSWCLTA